MSALLLASALLLMSPSAALAQPDDGAANADAMTFSSDTASEDTASSTPGTPWVVAFAPRFGLVVPTSELGLFVLGGLEIDFFLPVLNNQLVVALDITYTRPGMEGSVTDPRVGGPHDYSIDVDELKFGLDVVYRFFDNTELVVPFAGLGAVMHLLQSTEENDLGPGTHTEQSTAFGVELLGGADLRAGPGFMVGELRYVYTGLDHDLTGTSNAAGITATIGYRIGF